MTAGRGARGHKKVTAKSAFCHYGIFADDYSPQPSGRPIWSCSYRASGVLKRWKPAWVRTRPRVQCWQERI